MDRTDKNIRLGIFVILISVIFTFVIYRVSGGQGFIDNTITVYVEFGDVKGLLNGNIVRYSGIKVGTVKNVEIKSDKVLTVALSLNKDVMSYMKINTTAEIGTNGLVGNMLVNLSPGSGEADLIQDGDTIENSNDVGLSEMLGTLSTTNDKLVLITDNLLEITQKINKGSGSVARLINDGSLVDNLQETTKNLAETSALIQRSTNRIDAVVEDVSNGKGNLGYLLRDSSLKIQVRDLATNMDSLLIRQTRPILDNLTATSEALAASSGKLESIIKGEDEGSGPLNTLLNDTAMTADLKETIENLNEGTKKFDESMEALQHHWLLRGFFKKKEKEAQKADKKD